MIASIFGISHAVNIVEVYEPVNNVEHELDTDKDSAMELSKFTGRKSIALSEVSSSCNLALFR